MVRPTSLREPELWPSAQRIKAGEGSREEHLELVNRIKPVRPYDAPVAPASSEQMADALQSTDPRKVPLLHAPRALEEGTPVAVRLDIPAYEKKNAWIVSVHEPKPDFTAGKVIGYDSVAHITDPQFGVHEGAALNIASGKGKATIATVKGNWKPTTPEDAHAYAQQIHNDPEWRQVGMDPERHSFFYDRETQQPVVAAEEALHIGPLVYAKNPTYDDPANYKFAQGGEVFSPVQGLEAYHEDPAFQEWFGNSVTHREGVPVTYYTGTSKDVDFNKFNVGRHGAWFTADPAEASQYAVENDSMGYRRDGWDMKKVNTASRVIPAHLKIENPYTGPLPDWSFVDNYKKAQSDFFDMLRSKGHDGWIPAEHGGKLAVVLKEPHQIKTVNNRTWDAKNPRMDKAAGGEVEPEADWDLDMSGIEEPPHPGITAYHGSPYDFNRFRLSKIGTGEGAQMYGHGLYKAENPDVARSYRDSVMQAKGIDPEMRIGNVPLHVYYDRMERQLARMPADQAEQGYNRLSVLEDLGYGGDVLHIRSNAEQGAYDPEALEWFEKEIAPKFKREGRLYEVHIDAHPDHFLDWDRPSIKQSEFVRSIADQLGQDIFKPQPPRPVVHLEHESGAKGRLNALNAEDAEKMADYWRKQGSKATISMPDQGFSFSSGGEFYNALSEKIGKEKASRLLHEAGIKGIRYLDQGSRGEGTGTHNYVVFDDKLVDVKKKYADGGVVKEEDHGKEAREDRKARAGWSRRTTPLIDQHPTKYMPHVGRQVMADGGPIVKRALELASVGRRGRQRGRP